MVGTTGLPPAYRPPVIQIALLLTQEAPRRLRRRHFAFPFACESELSPLPEKQNPQLSLRASCSSGRLDSNQRPLAPHASALPGCATSRNPKRREPPRTVGCKGRGKGFLKPKKRATFFDMLGFPK